MLRALFVDLTGNPTLNIDLGQALELLDNSIAIDARLDGRRILLDTRNRPLQQLLGWLEREHQIEHLLINALNRVEPNITATAGNPGATIVANETLVAIRSAAGVLPHLRATLTTVANTQEHARLVLGTGPTHRPWRTFAVMPFLTLRLRLLL